MQPCTSLVRKLQIKDGMSLGCLSQRHHIVPDRRPVWDVLGKAEHPGKGIKCLPFLMNAPWGDLVLSSKQLSKGRPFPRPEMEGRKPSATVRGQ